MPKRKTRPISLALHGGAAHGAFTWGVLDRLLDEPGLQTKAITQPSAGATTAAPFAAGSAAGGTGGPNTAH